MQPCNDYYTPRRRPKGEHAPARTPAARIVSFFGGPSETAQAAEVAVKSVYRWLQARPRGCGGRVPANAQNRLIATAEARGLALTYADFAPRAGEAFT